MWTKLVVLFLLALTQVSADCELNGVMHGDGDFVTFSCMILECNGDLWEPTGYTDDDCIQCSGHNDPHWVNFAGCAFDYHGLCNYSIAVIGDLGVEGDFYECMPPYAMPSCFYSITYRDDPTTVITLVVGNTDSVYVNSSPFFVDGYAQHVESGGMTHNAMAWKHDANCIRVAGSWGISLSFCGWALYVWADPDLVPYLDGLCDATPPLSTPCPDASVEEINAWGDSLELSGLISDECRTNSSNTSLPRPQRDVRMKRDLPMPCNGSEYAFFKIECEAKLSAVYYNGHHATYLMLEIYTKFCAIDLCYMYISGETAAERGEWLDVLATMMKSTIQAKYYAVDPLTLGGDNDSDQNSGDNDSDQNIAAINIKVVQEVNL